MASAIPFALAEDLCIVPVMTTSPVASWKMYELLPYVGQLSKPSKMPGFSYSLPAAECKTGRKLQAIAGSTCSGCYAMKGAYVWPVVRNAMYRRFSRLAAPLWVEAMSEILNRRARRHPDFRWHDSGDVQSVDHLRRIVAVAEATPTVRHWLPTREYQIVRYFIAAGGVFPENLNVRLSAHMIGGILPSFPRLAGIVTISTVSRSADTYPDAYRCPAPSQNNACLGCRACWTPAVQHVDYAKH